MRSRVRGSQSARGRSVGGAHHDPTWFYGTRIVQHREMMFKPICPTPDRLDGPSSPAPGAVMCGTPREKLIRKTVVFRGILLERPRAQKENEGLRGIVWVIS